MKRRIISLVLAGSMLISVASCSILDPTEATTAPEETTEPSIEETEPTETYDPNSIMGFNMIENGDFADKNHTWGTYFEGGEADLKVNADGELQLDIKKEGTVNWANQVFYDGFSIYKDCKYEIQFDCHSTIERDVEYRIQINGKDYHPYHIETLKIGPEVQHFDFIFTMEEDSDPAPRLCLNMGKFKDAPDHEAHSVMFDNFDLRCIDDTAYLEAGSVQYPAINLNQIGYLPNASKVAVLNGDAIGTKASVIDVSTGSAVYEGDVAASEFNNGTGRDEARFDFSSVTAPGTYKVVAGDEESFEFVIADNVYDDAFKATLRMFYLQRCGVELTDDLAGDFAHPGCHAEEATVYGTDTKIDVSGGWHDAGDYGRYVVSGAKAAADLMLAYSLYPSAFDDALNIPESGNGIPDVLDEVRFELEWLLKMQNEEGGVYHKVTCANFPGFVMPEEETEELIVTPVSTTATGDFAAVMAMAANIYSGIDNDFGAKCLEAAVKAYEYLDSHPNIEGTSNPDGIVTGEYPDSGDADERAWAYAELFKATGDAKYDDAFCALIGSGIPCASDLGWQGVGAYAGYAYLSSTVAKGKFYDAVLASFMSGLADVEAATAGDAYNSSLTEYPWGSNMSIANNGMYVILYDRISGGNAGDECARDQLNYLLGTNGLGYCFLSGFGTVSPEQPHHRPSQAQGKAMPGMIAGGPDQNLEDPYAANVFADTAPALCYADNDQAYSLNEITIYWNSPVVFLFAYVSSQG